MNEESKLFTNLTKEDFTGYWNSRPTTIKAGESALLPSYLADHFAKHLADRECNKLNKATDGPEKEQFMKSYVQVLTLDEEAEQKEIEVEKVKKADRPKKKVTDNVPDDKNDPFNS